MKKITQIKSISEVMSKDNYVLYWSYDKKSDIYLLCSFFGVWYITRDDYLKDIADNKYFDFKFTTEYPDSLAVIDMLIYNDDELSDRNTKEYSEMRESLESHYYHTTACSYISEAPIRYWASVWHPGSQSAERFEQEIPFKTNLDYIYTCSAKIDESYQIDGIDSVFDRFCMNMQTYTDMLSKNEYNLGSLYISKLSKYKTPVYELKHNATGADSILPCCGLVIYTSKLKINKKQNSIYVAFDIEAPKSANNGAETLIKEINEYLIKPLTTSTDITNLCSDEFIDRYFKNNTAAYNKIISVLRNSIISFAIYQKTTSAMVLDNIKDEKLNSILLDRTNLTDVFDTIKALDISDFECYVCDDSYSRFRTYINFKYIFEHINDFKIDVTNKSFVIKYKNKKINIYIGYGRNDGEKLFDIIAKYDETLANTLRCKKMLLCNN